MNIINAAQSLRAAARRWLAQRGAAPRHLGLAALLLAAPLAHAEFQNGSFENGFANWTVTPLEVPGGTGITPFPPTTYDDLKLTDRIDGSQSLVLGAALDGNTDSKLKTPLFGDKSARVGDSQTGNRAASIRQTATMGVGDIDPDDGKVHLRFAVAPVLHDINHPGHRQPYFFVEVKNLTKGTQLFHTFNFSRQTGVAWQLSVGSYLFTNWQAIDIAPGPNFLDPGDQVEVVIVAAGCADGGHAGYVYVDSGHGLTTLPGPFVTATGPDYALRSDVSPGAQHTIAYNYHYSNGGSKPMVNTQLVITSPQDQDQRNASGSVLAYQQNLRVDPTSVPAACTLSSTPEPSPNTRVDKSLGTIDTVTCPVGTINPGNTHDMTLRWIVPSDARGPSINHGNYYIESADTPPLLGPLLTTEVTTLKLADLKAMVTNTSSSLTCGASTTYTVTLENGGPDAAPAGVVISNAVPAGLTAGSWSCADTGNTTLVCPAASGTGPVTGTSAMAWPAGDKLVYTANASVNACPGGAALITYPVTVALPTELTTVDPEGSNNTGTHVLNAGPALRLLNVTSIGTGMGKVTSVLPGIVCDKTTPTQCTDAKQFPQGSQVALYANAPANSIFAGWSGGGCSGTAQPCMVTMDQAQSVTAAFATPANVQVVVTPGGGSVTPPDGTQMPVAPGGTASITVLPSTNYAPVFGGTCAAGSYVGNTYTSGAVSGDCTVEVSFTNTGALFTATPNAPANGSVIGGPKTVQPNGSATWKLVPNSGFAPNPAPGGTCPAGAWNADRTEYTVSPINANCSITFAFASAHTVTGSVSGSSPGPGAITAGSSQAVVDGGSAIFTLSRPGTVDAASTCTGGSFDAANTTYTVPNVTAGCAMVFSFAALPPAPANAHGIPTLSQWGLVFLSGLMGLFMVGMRRRMS